MLVADLAVPRDADPEIGQLPGVTLVDIDGLEALAQARNPLTSACLEAAREIACQNATGFWDWLETRQRVPLIRALRFKANQICEQEVEQTLRRIGPELSLDQQQAIRVMAQAIVNKMLHEPIHSIKEPPAEIAREAYLKSFQAIYGLKSPDLS